MAKDHKIDLENFISILFIIYNILHILYIFLIVFHLEILIHWSINLYLIYMYIGGLKNYLNEENLLYRDKYLITHGKIEFNTKENNSYIKK